MGVVYEALQEDLGRRVAIKLLSGDVSAGSVARFRTEAEAMARLGHPHVVQISEFQQPPDAPPFLVMELLGGRSLRELLQAEGVLSWERASRIALQVLDALGAAHAARIVHRDVKPENVFLVSSTAMTDLVKVLDFGIAKLETSNAPVTRPGALIGTVAYMAPEQTAGAPVDARADLYAVGVCLYEAVAGRRPHHGADVGSLLAAIASAQFTSLEQVCPHLPPAFCAVVERALRADPATRFQTAEEMASALTECLGVRPQEPPPTVRTSPTIATGVPTTSSPPAEPRVATVAIPMVTPGSDPRMAAARFTPPPPPPPDLSRAWAAPRAGASPSAPQRSVFGVAVVIAIVVGVLALGGAGALGLALYFRALDGDGGALARASADLPVSGATPTSPPTKAATSAPSTKASPPSASTTGRPPPSTPSPARSTTPPRPQPGTPPPPPPSSAPPTPTAPPAPTPSGPPPAPVSGGCATDYDCMKNMGSDARCVQGACRCKKWMLCDGKCVGAAEPDHCGGCGRRCAANERCATQTGAMFPDPNATSVVWSCQACPARNAEGHPLAACTRMYCTDLSTDHDHCGACFHACEKDEGCFGGKCR